MLEQRDRMDEFPAHIRVLQIWNEYLPVFTGAAIRHNQLAALLPEHGITIEAIVPQTDGLAEREMINGVMVTRVPSGPMRNKKVKSIWGAFFLCRELWVRRKEYDLIHAVSTNEFWAPVFLFGRLVGKPVVVEFTLLESNQKSLAARLLTKIANIFYRRMHAYIAISSPLVYEIKARGLPSSKCFLIHYGVYPDHFVPLDDGQRKVMRDQLGLNQTDYYLIFVGSFIKRKGIDILIEMMDRLSRVRPDLHLILIGEHDFPYLPRHHPAHQFARQMKELISRDGLQERVHLVNRLEYDQVLRWLQAADIFVFPSRREGLGRVVLEAMSVGLACVCSEMDGIAYDIVEPEVNGVVVRENVAEAFAEQVIRLIEDPDLRDHLGSMARRTVLERFDESKITLKYKQLFESLLGSRNRPL